MSYIRKQFIITVIALNALTLPLLAIPGKEDKDNTIRGRNKPLVSSSKKEKASNKEEDVKEIENSLSALTLTTDSLLFLTPEKDPFVWQIGQHYKKLVQELEKVSTNTLITVVQKLIRTIKTHSEFFQHFQESLFYNLKSTMYSWMIEDVLTRSNFYNEQMPPSPPEDDTDEEEDAWYVSYMEGFEKDDSDESDEEWESNAQYDSEEEAQMEEDVFAKWQLHKLWDMFWIDVDSLEDFKANTFTTENICTFLKKYVENGNYSWLINEYVEGTYGVSEDFAEKYAKEVGAPQKLLNSILGGLWFDYDWEEFDVEDARFLPKTYVKTLQNFIKGDIASDVKKHAEQALRQLLLYNPEDFMNPFEELKIKYNKFAKQHDWRNALVVWSVYSIYRKAFEQKKRDEKLLTAPPPLFPLLTTFNREANLLGRLMTSLQRAQQYYTKVYPHPDTAYVVYGSKNPGKVATLDLNPALSRLKSVGQKVEPFRPLESKKQRKNILVPKLYFIISDRPYRKGGGHKRIFIPVTLDLPFLKGRLLSKNQVDGVFTKEKSMEEYYHKKAKKDYIDGQVLRGLSKEEATTLFERATDRELIHSERVWIELLRDEKVVDSIVESLSQQVAQQLPEVYGGELKVYSVLALLYSTNSVCPYCTPSLIAAQNSHTERGFMALLTEKLNCKEKKDFSFKTRGYDQKRQQQDPAKFRFHTIVTATTNFDPEANDLADQGQHAHTRTGKNKPPQNHNPHAKLIFPEDSIDLHAEPLQENGKKDPVQRFFYEFVGKGLHKETQAIFPFPEVVFTSGGDSWQVPQTVLK